MRARRLRGMAARRTWLPLVAALALLTAGCGGGAPSAGQAGAKPPSPAPPAAPPASLSIDPAGPAPISPTTPIVVHAAGGRLGTVTVTNAAGGPPVAGNFSPDRLSWTTTQPLGYATHYTVVADAAGGPGQPARQTFTVSTVTPAHQAYANLIPAPEVVAQPGIGVGQPIVFQFTKPVVNKAEVEKRLHISSDPQQEGAWYWTDDRNAHFRPQQYWQPGTTIKVSANVFGLDLGNGTYGAEDNSGTYRVHDSWIARADGATEQVQAFHNGQLVMTMPMSLGSPGHPSHVGPHVISDKQPSIIMDSCSYGVCKGQPDYYHEKVDLDERISNDGEFVHSAPWSVGQQGNANVSHGCVNLAPDNAQWFFNNFGLGDVVEITNSGGPPLPVWDLYGDWEVPWPQWLAGNANS